MIVRSGIDWDRQPLGKLADVELARQLGVSRGSVQAARLRRGIPPIERVVRERPDRAWYYAWKRRFPKSDTGRRIADSVVDALGSWEPLPFRLVRERVRDDYGAVSRSSLQIVLQALRRAGRISYVIPDGEPASNWGYVRRRKTDAEDCD